MPDNITLRDLRRRARELRLDNLRRPDYRQDLQEFFADFADWVHLHWQTLQTLEQGDDADR